ncbi:hypothetical protein [Kitasatospora sp. GP82]|uniref:hypothetical protein n=1 Tax=Kitasatospora sp. GP82 TaxID=3035089 RepID=UPI0024763201|nr:hypothetical protein [Kitasatospora sp. GP82]MDH6126399.1 hypothetical protein [Kitasatospora sp. GP82]
MTKLKSYLSVALATTALAVGGALAGSAYAAAPSTVGSHLAQGIGARGGAHLRTDSHIYPPAQLCRNQAWTSGNGRTVLRVQEDGNFVLYKDGRPVWQAPGAYPNGNCAVMQEDGNFVLYDRGGHPLWASGTWHKGAYLAVQDDGNVVVYNSSNRPVWATNTGD